MEERPGVSEMRCDCPHCVVYGPLPDLDERENWDEIFMALSNKIKSKNDIDEMKIRMGKQ